MTTAYIGISIALALGLPAAAHVPFTKALAAQRRAPSLQERAEVEVSPSGEANRELLHVSGHRRSLMRQEPRARLDDEASFEDAEGEDVAEQAHEVRIGRHEHHEAGPPLAAFGKGTQSRGETGKITLKNNWTAPWGDVTWSTRSGFCILNGKAKIGKTNSSGSAVGLFAQLPSKCRPQKQQAFTCNAGEYTTRCDVLSNGQIKFVAGGQLRGYLDLSGIVFSTSLLSSTPLELGWDWKNKGGNFGNASVTHNNGLCLIEGMITGKNWGSMGVLPRDCWPKKRLMFLVNNNEYHSRVDIQTNGVVGWHAGGKSHEWISLSGLLFSTSFMDSSTLPTRGNWLPMHGHWGGITYTRNGGVCTIEGMAKLTEVDDFNKFVVASAEGGDAARKTAATMNGDWVENGKRHGKTEYKNSAGGWLRWEQVPDWGAVNLGTKNKAKWCGGISGHHRYYNEAETSVPPTTGWLARGEPCATGSITVTYEPAPWGTIAKLPDECRPNKTLQFSQCNHEYMSQINVDALGNVIWKAGGKSHGFVSLTGIHFEIEELNYKGPKGDQGVNGDKGAKGAKGSKGSKGSKGGVGPPGLTGINGTNGTDGADGPPGPMGLPGLVGWPGIVGSFGEKGGPGDQGVTGGKGDDSSAPVPIDCAWADWLDWYQCSSTCRGGFQKRYRAVSVLPQSGGQECAGRGLEAQPCNDDVACPANGMPTFAEQTQASDDTVDTTTTGPGIALEGDTTTTASA